MSLQTPSFFNAKTLCVCCLNISFAFGGFSQVQAQSVNRSTLTQKPRTQVTSPIFAAPPPPKDIGEPGRRSEAGSRGCDGGTNKQNAAQKKLTAIVPFYSKSESVYGLTTAEYPMFWFYVPYASNIAYGEFVLEDEAENQRVYKVPLTGTPGIVNLRLPSTAQPLQIGKQHRWYFNVYCNDDKQIIGNVEGYIKREQLNPTLKTQLEKATPAQRVNIYGGNGIWYEALSNAAQLRRSNPRDTSWVKLLQEVGLDDLVNQPIVDCCGLRKE